MTLTAIFVALCVVVFIAFGCYEFHKIKREMEKIKRERAINEEAIRGWKVITVRDEIRTQAGRPASPKGSSSASRGSSTSSSSRGSSSRRNNDDDIVAGSSYVWMSDHSSSSTYHGSSGGCSSSSSSSDSGGSCGGGD